MWRIPVTAFRHGWLAAATVLGLVALATPFAARVRVDVSADNLIAKNSPQRTAHDAALAAFGSDEVAAVYAEDPELFGADRIRRLREINDALARLPFVQRAESLFTLPDIRDEGGLINTSPLLARIPDGPAALASARDRAMANPLIRGQVLSADGTATIITLYLSTKSHGLSAADITREIDDAIEPHRAAFAHLFQVGKPATQSWMAAQLLSDQTRILPLAVLALVALLAFSLRNAVAAIFPIANAAIAIVWSFAAMAAIGIPVNLLNYTLPALLLTSATTVLGFASTALSDLPILQDFGIAAAIAMTARFFTSVLFLPACFRIALPLIRPGQPRHAGGPPPWTTTFARGLVSVLTARPRSILALILLVTAAALWCAGKIGVTNDLQSFLRPDAPLTRQAERVASKLPGLKILYLTLHGEPDDFAEPRSLRQLAAIAAHVRAMDGIDSATAITDILGRINAQLHGGDPAFDTVPPTAAAVRLPTVPDTRLLEGQHRHPLRYPGHRPPQPPPRPDPRRPRRPALRPGHVFTHRQRRHRRRRGRLHHLGPDPLPRQHDGRPIPHRLDALPLPALRRRHRRR